MRMVKGGVTAPKGFLASSAACGIKKSGSDDLALLVSVKPCLCAGTFTTNRFKSGSVVLTKDRMKKGIAQAAVINSGNANACLGKKEITDARSITASVAKKLNLNKDLVLIASTGIIGKVLPIDKIQRKVGSLTRSLKKTNSAKFSKAIMTTDIVHKEIAVTLKIGGKDVVIAGAVKGSGMICPDMATMLAFFTTDAVIDKSTLRTAFKECVEDSFNKITVDGDMSTNDTAIIFANSLAGNRIIKKNSLGYNKFLNGLRFVAKDLAKKIVLDGEGATKFVEIIVKGAKDFNTANRVARHVADSSLVKTMIAGGDPNWGRVAGSIGAAGVDINKDKVKVYFGKRLVLKNGSGIGASRKILTGIFRKKEIEILIDLNSGKASQTIWTCDLTEDYVTINSEYEI
ncbi:MAG: bifunctional glutamate N-acetyltransferase/amino-acid acetyltransferase ArgJ, partial [Candidatus Omnitrophota bacterium]|nr:bifunctional glutamate N-acetyltransferase/amino-acid acetyltransferase ArgJ [Candidatus Omnitrophota bacterium]